MICKQLEDSTLLYEKQYRFRRRLSTTVQLFITAKQFASALNEHGQVDVMARDFSKAFDKATQAKLNQPLMDVGVDESLVW